jgi:tRNA modification GTPase
MRDSLLDLLAHLEANLDFGEEPDVDPLARSALADHLSRLAAELAALGHRLAGRDRPDGHPRVVLVGPPNAGKSRLFNALLARDRAIVSARAGTTRDYLTETCTCDGLAVELVDTAGLEDADGPVATQAQTLRERQVAAADLLLDCRSADTCELQSQGAASSRPRLLVWTKADSARPPEESRETAEAIVTSAVTGLGLDELRSAIARTIRQQETGANLPAGTAARCRGSIHRAGAALESAAETIERGGGDELVAFDLRLAVDELGKVVGAVVTDDVLDRIFSRFCIGK